MEKNKYVQLLQFANRIILDDTANMTFVHYGWRVVQKDKCWSKE